MALYFPKSNSLLLLTPKTGSTWIRSKIKELGIVTEFVGDDSMRDHDNLSHIDRSKYKYIGAFVRNPVTWYRSYWAYRIERGWREQYAIDEHCKDENFTEFVRKAVTILPGALGNIYRSYVGDENQVIDFIGKQESLESDFLSFLSNIGECDVDRKLLSAGPLINATSTVPEYTEELKELITVSEFETMQRFNYLEPASDAINLKEIQERFPEDKNELRLLALWTYKIHWAPDDKKKENGIIVSSATQHARIHSNYALFSQYKKSDLEYAEHRYKKALALDPNHPRTLCNYALFLWKNYEATDKARELMFKALHGRPNHPYTLGKLARLMHKGFDDKELAELFYKQSLLANGAQKEVVFELIDLLEQQGKTQEIVALYETSISAMDESDELYLAYILFLHKNNLATKSLLKPIESYMEKNKLPETAVKIYSAMAKKANQSVSEVL